MNAIHPDPIPKPKKQTAANNAVNQAETAKVIAPAPVQKPVPAAVLREIVADKILENAQKFCDAYEAEHPDIKTPGFVQEVAQIAIAKPTEPKPAPQLITMTTETVESTALQMQAMRLEVETLKAQLTTAKEMIDALTVEITAVRKEHDALTALFSAAKLETEGKQATIKALQRTNKKLQEDLAARSSVVSISAPGGHHEP